MAGIVQEAGTGVVAGCFEKALVRHAIVEVFSRMDLVTKVYTIGIKLIKDRQPAFSQLLETCFHQAGGTLGPGIYGLP